MDTSLAAAGWEEQLSVKINQMNVTIADHIYEVPMSEFPVNLESTIEEKQRSASDSGSEMYQECVSGLYFEQ
jgi:hypothetical protein